MKFSVVPVESSSQQILSKEHSSPREGHVYLDSASTAICFKDMQKIDEGMYIVTSKNDVGQCQASFHLKLKRKWNCYVVTYKDIDV